MKPKVKLYYDGRKCGEKERCPVYIKITHIGTTSYIVTDIHLLPSEWNKEGESVIRHPNKTAFNRHLSSLVEKYQSAIDNIVITKDISAYSATQIKSLLLDKPVMAKFADVFIEYAEQKSAQTRKMFLQSLDRIRDYDENTAKLSLDDINEKWLLGFEKFLRDDKKHKENTIIWHITHIRTILNYAIDKGLTKNVVFRKYRSLKPTATKRSLEIEELRKIMLMEDHRQQKWVDLFKLSFFLVGINFADLFHLKEIKGGRIEFIRQKTKRTQKILSIKVEAEAQAIIDKYRGKDYLLNFLEEELKRPQYKNASAEKIAASYQNITSKCDTHLKQVLKGLSSYYARHTWASIAYNNCDIPIDTIAQSLGHSSGHKTTNIYISADYKRVDEANRKVIDFVLYGK